MKIGSFEFSLRKLAGLEDWLKILLKNIFCGGSYHLIRLNIKGTQNAMLCRYVRQNVDSYVPGDLPVLMRERIKQHL